MSIYFIRHGESTGNADHGLYSKIPTHKMELTEKGRKQAIEAGIKVKNDIFKLYPNNLSMVKIITSPYIRTMQTTDGIISQLPWKVERNSDYRIIEQRSGNYHDADKLDKEREAYHKFYYTYPNGESAYDVLLRCLPFYERLKESPYNIAPTIIVSHSRTIRILRMLIEKKDAEWFHSQGNFPNATIFKYNGIGYPEEPSIL